jgi:hypothetical protein
VDLGDLASPGDDDDAPAAGEDAARVTSLILAAPLPQRPSRPPVLHAPPPAEGEITLPYVRQVVGHDLLPDLVRCYTARAEQTPLGAERVHVRLQISADGRVVATTAWSPTVGDAVVDRCITHTFGAYRFPATSAGATLTYPLVFGPLEPISVVLPRIDAPPCLHRSGDVCLGPSAPRALAPRAEVQSRPREDS